MNTTTDKAAAASPPTVQDDTLDKLEAQGKEWDAQLALWSAKLEKASVEARAEFHTWQREFQHKRAEAKKALEELRDSGKHAWAELTSGAQSAWTEVRTAFETARKKFS